MSAAEPEIIGLDTVNLGDRSYVVAVDGQAVVVDPQRDVDRVLDVLTARRLTLTHVLETHVHNDYVSGGLVLARETGASYGIPAGEECDFAASHLAHGDVLDSGAMRWRVLHTPGHTPTHLSYVVSVEGNDRAVFTGGSLLHGSVGRPDLFGTDLARELAQAQWRSARRLVAEVAGQARLCPTHGFGSFCSAGPSASDGSGSLLDQLDHNPALTMPQEPFVDDLLAGLDAYPAYYARMAPLNRSGPGPADLTLPQRADPAEVLGRIESGEWVVDLRDRRVFAACHLRGSLSFPLDGNAVTYLGWLVPWGTPLTLVAATVDDVAGMQRELVRIGIERPAAFLLADSLARASAVDRHTSSYPVSDFMGLRAALDDDPALPVLDVRLRSEWESGHLVDARHLPVHELPAALDDLRGWTDGKAVWIYCGSGYRAGVAASLLDAAGLPVVQIADDSPPPAATGLDWQVGP